ncbi:DUF1672 family protein [Isobaculum melis]|uniref:Uncharacterized protein n=1 Tax=Isobaculum melis TaxID=142588 RepID=A0A1H9S008_9LACT|nr:DUF1672 family protein [Isobaculum melis]SER78370.1 Protein of unknown function [Isobaculum melis]
MIANEYMQQNFKTDVEITSYIPLENTAVVLFKTKQEPVIHSSFYVMINHQSHSLFHQFNAHEGEIEQSIVSGLYHYAYEDEFNRFNEKIEELKDKYSVVSLTEEAHEKTYISMYREKNYYIGISSLDLPSILEFYKNKQTNISKEEILPLIKEYENNPAVYRGIVIRLYMKENESEADGKILNDMINDMKKLNIQLKGNYYINLMSNNLIKDSGHGVKNIDLPIIFDDSLSHSR